MQHQSNGRLPWKLRGASEHDCHNVDRIGPSPTLCVRTSLTEKADCKGFHCPLRSDNDKLSNDMKIITAYKLSTI